MKPAIMNVRTPAMALFASLLIQQSSGTADAHCCGERTSPNQPRIVGGSTAPRGAYPWMAALVERGQTPQNGQFCGGALIHPQWVLTAGHCVEGTSASRLDVIVGAYDLREANGGGQRIQVIQIITHPGYGDAGGTLVNDVALLKLATPVTNLPVIPLVDGPARIAAGQPCKGMGFGVTREGGTPSPILLHVDLGFFSLASANAVYGGITDVHVAAGIAAGGRDTCQGDSGGPLVVPDGRGGWMHAGVVSFGDGCARPDVPGIYASTLKFTPWIQQNVGAVTPPPVDDFGNTLATAATATLGTTVSGRLEVAGDVDMFKVSAPGAGTLTAAITGTVAMNGQWLNASGAVIAAQTGTPAVSLSASVAAAGTYYLAVRGGTTALTGPYSMTVAFVAAPTAGAPEFDLLGKNSAAIPDGSLTTVATNGTHLGTVVAGSPASQVFTIRNSGNANLSVSSVQIGGAAAGQFRVSVQPAATVAAARTATFTIVYAPSSAGNHVADLTIGNSDGNENPYNVRIAGTATAPPTGDDHGNSTATATPVSAPGSRTGRLEARDVDFFRFTVTARTTLTVRTTGLIDTYGTLYDNAGRYLTEADDAGDLNFSIRRQFNPGTYYIAVEGYDAGVAGAYTLQIAK